MHQDEIIIGPSSLSAEQQRLISETLDSILACSYFKRSKRYPALLEFAVRNTLTGNLDVLKERTVGVQVFDRGEDYDPITDSVVRMAASEVRKRLALYFSEQPNVPVRIELPPGSYTAEFHFRSQPASENVNELPKSSNHETSMVAHSGTRRRWAVSIAAIAAVVLPLAIWCTRQLNPAQPVERFWAPLLKAQTTVSISLGTPYKSETPKWEAGLPDTALVDYIHKHPNNPVPDISDANLINQFLGSRGKRSEVRMASSIQFSDLQKAPAVLIGGGPMSPWTMRLGSDLRFQFQESEDGAVHGIVDRNNPANLDWKVDLRLPYDQVGADYALVSRQLNPTTGQWWIGIGGTTNVSTDEATKMLMDRAAMKALEAQLPRGWESKNVQFVIEVTLVDGSAGGLRVIATNVW